VTDEADSVEPEIVALENALRQVVDAVDPVPAAAVHAAIGSFAWRTIDAELAELAYDSLTARESATLVRGAGDPRLLTFGVGEFTVELEVSAGAQVYGQVVPAGPVTVQIRHRGGVVELAVDDLGRFGPGQVRPGPVSLRFVGAGGPPVVTEWIPV
jgi:hypothetical protein